MYHVFPSKLPCCCCWRNESSHPLPISGWGRGICLSWRWVRVFISPSWSWQPFHRTGAPLRGGCHCPQLTWQALSVVVVAARWSLANIGGWHALTNCCQTALVLRVRVVGVRWWGDRLSLAYSRWHITESPPWQSLRLETLYRYRSSGGRHFRGVVL